MAITETSDLPLILVDKHQVLQILINLLSNAKQSLRLANRDARNVVIYIGSCSDFDTPQVEVQVADDGVGIATDALEKIFTRGFTTKVDGHGFGLHGAMNSRETAWRIHDGLQRGRGPGGPPSH